MRFKKGDKIKANGRKYEITDIDIKAKDDRVLQYNLDAIGHDIPARLKPHTDGLTLIEYRDLSGDIEIIEEVEE